ncbi:MAG: DUF6318 family protein [Aeromicrobium sp.]|uniref:DUF6318 family protein n=1 Tax=Aeromicrobium sp. TaxID=1871063 RepID=UPI0039E34A99
MRSSRLLVVFLLAALLMLSGCSKEPEPIEPDPTPTPVEPVLPEAAKENTEDGALAFLEHYLAVMDYASSTGDITQLTELSHPECTGCKTYVDLFTERRRNGGWVDGGGQSTSDVSVQTINGEVLITANIHHAEGTYQESKSEEPGSFKPSTVQVTHGLFWTDDRWYLTQMFLGEVPAP